MRFHLPIIVLTAISGLVTAQEMWDLPPILYSKTAATDPLAKLVEEGTSLPQDSEQETLRFLLRLLEIPESSQILVYSKTSAQNYFINPRKPRAIHFNENAYVGHVLGGGFELIIHDDHLGVVFYFIEPEPGGRKLEIQRNTTSCLNCHATRRTELVPGLTVRSVPTDADGNLLLPLGSTRTDHRTPLPKRWAGYYVTGGSALPHLGNRIFTPGGGLLPDQPPERLKTVSGKIDSSRYLTDTSDIVALMVLEHQCLIHNLLINASMELRRASWMEKASGGRQAVLLAEAKARAIVDVMLFKDEAPMGDGGVDGAAGYQTSFTARFPKTKAGDSLADFHLGNRLFKNRCSYMIHSKAFISLPPAVKDAVFLELEKRLTSGNECGWIPEGERKRILEILHETVPGFADDP
ncbi:hypothetical protein OVA24_13010 [Luteolibacter sp. SL250]|uniref:hypothetical protein n=1 Tax=Luteolibacter sp. SL250 TaxID=2995170 RepID=UPI00226F605E|nr:hypothetical protein [Luteolibacter sp. SL250]WAC18157.1 hypothetical protein OVA24_13010 [Luteolibacter sp. SL250]